MILCQSHQPGMCTTAFIRSRSYLAAIAEDSWFETESVAQRIADRIGDTKKHYTSNTVLENAEEILDELDTHRENEISAYRAIFDDDEFERLTDLSAARSKLSRFENEIVSGVWKGANKRFPVGSVHEAHARNIATFGVFVELEPGLNGLIHSSKLPMDFRVNDAFRRGEKILVSVLNVDRTEQRLELDWIGPRRT